MNVSGEIVFIDDDIDDVEIYNAMFSELNIENEVKFFRDSTLALDYLLKTDNHPFLIFSDIYMPKLDGLELRSQVYSNTEFMAKCIPYIFLTTSLSHSDMDKAYKLGIQGLFIKGLDYKNQKKILSQIIDYWSISKAEI